MIPDLAALTMNPTLDIACEVDKVMPLHKMRTHDERHDPGGGGINVARVFERLGGQAQCYYLTGGATGAALDDLLEQCALARNPIKIAGTTRVSTTVHETSSGQEYRFVPQGPDVTEAEWRECLNRLERMQHDYLVASGSLPPGVPEDFYARVAAIARSKGMRFVIDTSGPALAAGLAAGNVFLAKPNLNEFCTLIGEKLEDDAAIAEAGMAFVGRGDATYLAVTLGDRGIMLASKDGPVHVPAIAVKARSAVGAGDSFLAAMLYALAAGKTPEEALRFGLAAGTATVMTPGTDLCHAKDVHRLYAEQFKPF